MLNKYFLLTISLVYFLTAGFLSYHLHAGPIYASKWTNKNNGHEIVMYSDMHNTHKRPGDLDVEMAKELYARLAKLKQECLFLVEDYENEAPFTSSNMKNVCAIIHNLPIKNDDDKMFIRLVSINALQQLNNALLSGKNIDHRDKLNYLHAALENRTQYYNMLDAYDNQKGSNYVPSEEGKLILLYDEERRKNDIYLKAISAFKLAISTLGAHCGNISFCTLLKEPLKVLDGLAATTDNVKLRKIFENIANTIVSRHNLLLQTLLDNRFTEQELEELTLQQLIQINYRNDKYDCIRRLFYEMVLFYYDLEIVEAKALWQIEKSTQRYNKIIIIAGDLHIENLEKYLPILGYEQVEAVGLGFRRIRQEFVQHEQSVCKDYNSNQEDYARCGYFSAFLDHIMNKKTISKETKELEQKIDDLQNQAPLIPAETFDWIL